jgi:hypothetical protein
MAKTRWGPCPAISTTIMILSGILLSTPPTTRAFEPWARIHQPQHLSVVRRQSVELDVESNFLDAAEHGSLWIYVDGRIVSQVRQSRISIILADEDTIQEGVHEVRAVFKEASGHDLVRALSTEPKRARISCYSAAILTVYIADCTGHDSHVMLCKKAYLHIKQPSGSEISASP